MTKQFALIACLNTLLFINRAITQDDLKAPEAQATKRDTKLYNTTSLDGKIETVKIIPDYVHNLLMITCLTDTIRIPDFWGVPPEIQMLNKTFIQIKYEVRGGSNLGLGNILILCVNNSKLYEAMHALRYANWDSGDNKMDYHIKLNLTGDNKSNYSLIANIHDDVYSKKNLKQTITTAIKPF